jgi:hypothetical protein
MNLVPKCMLVCWKKDVENFPNLPFPSCGAKQIKGERKKWLYIFMME